MAITRINYFEAKPSLEDKLDAFLSSVLPLIKVCPGSLGCELLRSTENPAQFVVLEEWETIEAHKKAVSAIPKEKFAEAMELFAKPPTGTYYERE